MQAGAIHLLSVGNVSIFNKTIFVSHQPERTEKNCLNCGTLVAGRYCQQCGQENVPSHLPFFPLIRHFIYDIFHFDGKFFDTLRYLFFRPGYVPKQYVLGRRMSFLDPIRMYLFTSAIFFLIFFAFAPHKNDIDITGQNELSKAERFDQAARLVAQGAQRADTGLQPLHVLLDPEYVVVTDVTNDLIPYDSVYPVQWLQDGKLYRARHDPRMDSIPVRSNSMWMERMAATKWQRYKNKFGGDTDAIVQDFLDKLVHRFPYLLFLSLPFFAAILKLLYRRNKQLFYFDHATFTLYHYVFSFILLLFILGTTALENKTGWRLFSLTASLMMLSWPLHLLFAMKRFYVQAWGRTLVKFVLLNLLAGLVLLLLFMGFLFYSIYTI